MNEWVALAVGLILGLSLGGAAVGMYVIARRGRMQGALADAEARVELLDGALEQARLDIEAARTLRGEQSAGRERAEQSVTQLTERLRQRDQQFAEQKALLEELEKRFTDTFRSLGASALQANNTQFIELAKATFETVLKDAKGDVEMKQQAIDNLVKPIRELLDKQNLHLKELETKREVAYKGVEEQVRQIAAAHGELRTETGRLVTALRRPETRGRWGEFQLRLVVEMAGMERHCDFDEQVTIWKGEQTLRPDMVVHIPGGGSIPVDAKVALDAYEQAMQPEADRAALLKRHARQVAEHIHRLADKRYKDSFDRSPGVVVLFMSPESALIAALDSDPELQRTALSQHVLLATPTTLVALLRAMAYGWQQESVAANARQIAAVGSELFERLTKFVEHFEKIGDHLNKSNVAYNAAVGSLESRVLSSARKLRELHATTSDEIDVPPLVETNARTPFALRPATD